jgi:hypothetical protein
MALLEIPLPISVCSICGHGEWEQVTRPGKRVSVCATQHFTIVLARQIGVLVSWMERSGLVGSSRRRLEQQSRQSGGGPRNTACETWAHEAGQTDSNLQRYGVKVVVLTSTIPSVQRHAGSEAQEASVVIRYR